MVISSIPGNNYSLFAIVLWDLWAQIHWLSELSDLGAQRLVDRFQSLGTRCVVQIFSSSGKSWELGVPFQSYVTVPGLEFRARLCLSLFYPFQCGCFLSCPTCRGHTTFSGSLSLGELLPVRLYIWCICQTREIQVASISPSRYRVLEEMLESPR